MAGQVVQMDYPVIQATSKGFTAQSQVVKIIGQVGVATFTALEAGAWWCPPLSQWYGRCKEAVKVKSKELCDTLDEFAKDLDQAVNDHKKGDFEGKHYFGK
jgi:hypothetical protein